MDDADERTLRFAEIVRYAQKVLGGASGRASQRDLAAALGLAPTMVGRYLSANADFHHLRAITIERLAAAAQLEPGALFVWIREGRSAAMAYQQLMQQQPVAFEPIDLARQLVAMLDSGDPAVPAGAVEPMKDYGALQQDIADQRAVAPAMFDRLVAMADAAATLEKVNGSAALLHSDWLKLQQLLDAPAPELMQRYGFVGHEAARTPLLRA
jgi:transcriptional regulator with XRE-family HTH domain